MRIVCDKHGQLLEREWLMATWHCPVDGCSAELTDKELYRLTKPGNPAMKEIRVR
jgi:hypothetical protein